MASKFPPHESSVKPIHFFRIILAHHLHEGKLMIPNAFVKKNGESLPDTIFLQSPNGAEWKLNLVKSDGKIWFQKGWKEFAEDHSLAHGHLLVFRYEGTSHFQVHIFDMSALEIDYLPKREGKMASIERGNKPPNDANLKYDMPAQKRKDNLSSECHQPCEMRSCKRVKVENYCKLPKAVQLEAGKKCKGKPMNIANQATALDRASSFKPCNPSFLIFIHPSYVDFRGNLNLPSKFCKKHLSLDKKKRDVNLEVLNNGRVWPAWYVNMKTIPKTKFVLTSGWKAFNKDNKLRVGDVCIFELIPRTKLTFLVHIFRGNDSSNCSTSQAQKSEDNLSSEFPQPCQMKSCKHFKVENNLKLPKAVQQHAGKRCKGKPMAKQVSALDRASSFESCNPSFLIFMHPSCLESYRRLNLPSKFCRRHFNMEKETGYINLIRVLNGRIWSARYLIRQTTSMRTRFELIKSGWKAFAEDNKLKVGDVCTFELISRTELTFLVHIFRGNDDLNCSISQESVQMRAASEGQGQELKIITTNKSSPPRVLCEA